MNNNDITFLTIIYMYWDQFVGSNITYIFPNRYQSIFVFILHSSRFYSTFFFFFFFFFSLGVASPAAIWGEWIGTGHLLVFIPLSIGKNNLTATQWMTIHSFTLCLVFGFLIILPYGMYESIRITTYLPIFFIIMIYACSTVYMNCLIYNATVWSNR